eukprot:SAG11_NODE_1014_length_6184_cov_2.581265_3_plen_66_part_00
MPTVAICAGNQLSMETLRTWLTCVPSERWIPEHLRQMKTPRFTLAHCGSRLAQSAQYCTQNKLGG